MNPAIADLFSSTEQSPAADERLDRVEQALLSIPDVQQHILNGIARAVDEVIDPVRSARWSMSELDQPEKTVVGIRVENILRIALELGRSELLDLTIAGEDVDVKFTIGSNWAIPPEAVGEICLLTTFRESDHSVSAGLVRTSDDLLNPGRNRDGKRGLSSRGKAQIRWILRHVAAERSIVGFMASLSPGVRQSITDTTVGAQVRINRLFTNVQARPLPETLVEAVAQHKDWTRRMRPDSANCRAPGAAMGFDVLRQSSPDDRRVLAATGLQALPAGFCISIPLGA
jgi:hypothetical protein